MICSNSFENVYCLWKCCQSNKKKTNVSPKMCSVDALGREDEERADAGGHERSRSREHEEWERSAEISGHSSADRWHTRSFSSRTLFNCFPGIYRDVCVPQETFGITGFAGLVKLPRDFYWSSGTMTYNLWCSLLLCFTLRVVSIRTDQSLTVFHHLCIS